MHKYLIILTSFFLLLYSCEEQESELTDNTYSDIEIEILNLINSHRQSLGKEKLEMNKDIWQEATNHTNYMIEQGAISHDGFSERVDRLKEKIEGYSGAAENVAYGYPDANSVVTGWLNSSGHKKNIEGDYNLTGISAIKDSNGNYFYTQIFFKTSQ